MQSPDLHLVADSASAHVLCLHAGCRMFCRVRCSHVLFLLPGSLRAAVEWRGYPQLVALVFRPLGRRSPRSPFWCVLQPSWLVTAIKTMWRYTYHVGPAVVQENLADNAFQPARKMFIGATHDCEQTGGMSLSMIVAALLVLGHQTSGQLMTPDKPPISLS